MDATRAIISGRFRRVSPTTNTLLVWVEVAASSSSSSSSLSEEERKKRWIWKDAGQASHNQPILSVSSRKQTGVFGSSIYNPRTTETMHTREHSEEQEQEEEASFQSSQYIAGMCSAYRLSQMQHLSDVGVIRIRNNFYECDALDKCKHRRSTKTKQTDAQRHTHIHTIKNSQQPRIK